VSLLLPSLPYVCARSTTNTSMAYALSELKVHSGDPSATNPTSNPAFQSRILYSSLSAISQLIILVTPFREPQLLPIHTSRKADTYIMCHSTSSNSSDGAMEIVGGHLVKSNLFDLYEAMHVSSPETRFHDNSGGGPTAEPAPPNHVDNTVSQTFR
jgi:hypothetical protein